jgi:hypothetical protein
VLSEHRRTREPDVLRLRLPATGVAPMNLASSLLLVPWQLWNLGLAIGKVVEALSPGTTTYRVAEAVIVAASSLLFARWFNHPRRIAEVVAALSPEPIDRAALEGALSPVVRVAGLRSGAFLLLLTIGAYMGMREGSAGERITVQNFVGLELMLGLFVTAMVMDLAGEWRARKEHGAMASAWPEHRVYAVDPILDALAHANIPAHAKNVHLRTLLQFFGPFCPIEILVPEARVAEAREILRARLGVYSPRG